MKKLFELKEWLTVVEAAKHLSTILEEGVTEADVYRLALDRHLVLSVNFVNGARGKLGRLVPTEEAKTFRYTHRGHKPVPVINGIAWDDQNILELDEVVVPVTGLWNLTMRGAERTDIENHFQELTCGPPVETVSLVGPLMRRSDGVMCQIQTPVGDSDRREEKVIVELLRGRHKRSSKLTSYRPASSLPSDALLVVRTSALRDFHSTIALGEIQPIQPIGSRERVTILRLVESLARLAKLDPSRPSVLAKVVESETTQRGERLPVRTVENTLQRMRNERDG